MPFTGASEGQFSLDASVVNGNIGKYIKLIPTNPAGTVRLTAGAVGPASSSILASASRSWVDPSSTTWVATTLDTFAVAVPAGTRRVLFVEGVVVVNAQQNLGKILFNYSGTDYESSASWNTGFAGSARPIFLFAVPLGTSGSSSTPTVALKIQNVTGLNCQPQGTEYRYWIVDYTDQAAPVGDKQVQVGTDVAAAVTATLSVNPGAAGGLVLGFGTFGGGNVAGEKATSAAATVTDDSGSLATAGSKVTGFVAGKRTGGAGANPMTFDFTGGASGNKVGAVLVASRPDLSAAGGAGLTVVTTAANLVSSAPGGAISVTALTASMIHVEVE